jgi:ubiquinol oxidase
MQMYSMYHTFNFITGYQHINPTVQSIEWRLIMLESLAGVPGFLAAGFRHFHSLRTLSRDHGWITTLLEEAENERMHLLVCLKVAKAGFFTRTMVIALQVVMTPFLMSLYTVHPKAVHRFVGYLEETACHTYKSIIEHVETPGTHLHAGWANLPAPDAAIGYWRLPHDAKWVDALRCMFADEANHRDVNHTFAIMKSDDPNPFAAKHREDAMKAWVLEEKKLRAW